METPPAITWSTWPLRRQPKRAILLVFIILLLSSLVLFWLGWTWQSGALICALVFSLRDFLFARSVLVNREGLTLSTPLTGARLHPWTDVSELSHTDTVLKATLRKSSSLELELPEDEVIAVLDDWVLWHRAGAVDLPSDGPPPLTRQ